MRPHSIVAVALLGALMLAPLFAGSAQAATVNQSVFAKSFSWHVGSNTSTTTEIDANVGDTIHLNITNADDLGLNLTHTFTAPQFPAASGQLGGGTTLNVTLHPGATFVWNYTFVAADQGTWQFYCIPHSTGSYPNRSGMVGTFKISAAPTPPPTPGFDTVIVIAALVGVAAVVRVATRHKGK